MQPCGTPASGTMGTNMLGTNMRSCKSTLTNFILCLTAALVGLFTLLGCNGKASNLGPGGATLFDVTEREPTADAEFNFVQLSNAEKKKAVRLLIDEASKGVGYHKFVASKCLLRVYRPEIYQDCDSTIEIEQIARSVIRINRIPDIVDKDTATSNLDNELNYPLDISYEVYVDGQWLPIPYEYHRTFNLDGWRIGDKTVWLDGRQIANENENERGQFSRKIFLDIRKFLPKDNIVGRHELKYRIVAIAPSGTHVPIVFTSEWTVLDSSAE